MLLPTSWASDSDDECHSPLTCRLDDFIEISDGTDSMVQGFILHMLSICKHRAYANPKLRCGHPSVPTGSTAEDERL